MCQRRGRQGSFFLLYTEYHLPLFRVLRLLSHPGFDSESRSVEVSFEMASPQRRSSPSESHSLISPIGWQRNGHSQVLVPRAYLRTTGIHRKHSCFMFQRRPRADIVLRSRASRPQQQEVRTCRGVSVDRRNALFIKHSLSYNASPSFFLVQVQEGIILFLIISRQMPGDMG